LIQVLLFIFVVKANSLVTKLTPLYA